MEASVRLIPSKKKRHLRANQRRLVAQIKRNTLAGAVQVIDGAEQLLLAVDSL